MIRVCNVLMKEQGHVNYQGGRGWHFIKEESSPSRNILLRMYAFVAPLSQGSRKKGMAGP